VRIPSRGGNGRTVRNHGKWRRSGLIPALCCYVLSYILMSLSGHPAVANHGGSDWRREWFPKYLLEDYAAPSGRTRASLTSLGKLYWPCIFLDHLLWHRTERMGFHGSSERPGRVAPAMCFRPPALKPVDMLFKMPVSEEGLRLSKGRDFLRSRQNRTPS
jgi:hypothetical protein